MTAFPDTHPPERYENPRSRYVIDCAGAQLYVREPSLGVVLRIDGEIDASNANLVGQAIRRISQLKTPLILDLSHLDFLGVAGLRTLLVLDSEQQRAHLHFSVVPGVAMRPLMHIFSDLGLPVIDSVPEALRHTDGFA